MRFDFVALRLAALAALLVPALARRSRLVTRGLDVAVPLPTARSGGANGQGILTQCPLGTTACARHKHYDRNDGGASMSSTRPSTAVDCIDTEVDFRSCGGCRFPHKGQDSGEDCTQIEGAAESVCECGACVVRSCRPGYVLDPTEAFCAWHGIVDYGDGNLRDPKGWWWFL